MSQTVYQQLCVMFDKKSVDYSIAEAQGKAPCICGVKGADKCSANTHRKMATRTK